MRRPVMVEIDKTHISAVSATLKKFGFESDGKTMPGGENTVHVGGTLDDDAVDWVRKVEHVVNVWSNPAIDTFDI